VSLTKLTFQIAELKKNRLIGDMNFYRAGEHLPAERVNRYITDGEVSAANLTVV